MSIVDTRDHTSPEYEPMHSSTFPIAAGRLASPVSPLALEAQRRIWETAGQEAAEAHRTDVVDRRERAIGAEKTARQQLDEAEADLQEAHAACRETDLRPGSYSRAALFLTCAVVCFLAEFVLTWTTLPFVLNVRQYSILGWSLGMAPATALVVLDLVLLRLLEKPWRHALGSVGWRRVGAVVTMALFLIVLAGINLYGVSLLALTREQVAAIKYLLESAEPLQAVDADPRLIQQTVLVWSLCVTLDGALFLLLGLLHFRDASIRTAAKKRIRSAKRRRDRSLKHHHQEANVELARAQDAVDNVERTAQLVAIRCVNEQLLGLEAGRGNLPCSHLFEEALATARVPFDPSDGGRS